MPFYTAPGGSTLHYEDVGSGPPLVFIHGWSMSARVWLWQREALQGDYRLLIIDLPGHGESPPASDYSHTALTADLIALCRHLELTATTAIGWSLGAQLVLAMAAVSPELFSALVLIGGTPRFTSGDGFGFGLPAAEVRSMGLRLRRNYVKTMGEFFRSMFGPDELSHEQEQRIVHQIVMKGRLPEPETAERTLAMLAAADLRPLLREIQLPTLLIHGTDDRICHAEASRFMAEELPAARLEVLHGAGHAPFLSRPDDFNLCLRHFLAGIYGRN